MNLQDLKDKLTQASANAQVPVSGNTPLGHPDGVCIVRFLLAGPGRSTVDVREHLEDVALRHPDLDRHVRWLRRGIYAYAAAVLLRERHYGATFEPTLVGRAKVDQWIKVMWIIINCPQIDRSTAEHLTKCEFRSWDSFGYAPITQEILSAIGTYSPERLERLRGDFAKEMAGETRKYSPEHVDMALAALIHQDAGR